MEGFLHFFVARIILLVLASSFVSCYDPASLQDFFVEVNDNNGVFVNGNFCKDPKLVTAEDFFTCGLNIPGNTSNRLGSKITVVIADTMPSLNTYGVSLARTDFCSGRSSPTTHTPTWHRAPRSLARNNTNRVCFIEPRDNNRLISKVLYPGDAYVFPKGMIHYHENIGKTNAVTFSAGGSQNPGYMSVADSVFGSNPSIDPNALARAFALNVNTVKNLRTRFPDENILN